MLSAKVIEDSTYAGCRLVTFQLRYQRFIHGEFMTHRVFSRNASSSRAIPVEKMITMVRDNPARPIHWGKNQKGMQAKEELTGDDLERVQQLWDIAAKKAAEIAQWMTDAGLHKQVANRILEPFQWIDVICTASSYDNFFHLRNHEDAQPEIDDLAKAMKKALEASTTKELKVGEYHLPYIRPEERKAFSMDKLAMFSAARCARVSYLTHDGQTPSPENDLILFNRLVGSDPIHASPTEHIATPNQNWAGEQPMSGNFDRRWLQYRKFLEVNRTQDFFV